MKLKIKMVKLGKTSLEVVKAIVDSDKGLAKEYKGFPLPYLSKHSHVYDVKIDHLKHDPKGKPWLLIDINTRTSIDPLLVNTLDAEKLNRLDYLSESAFWDSLNLRKRDILELLITLGCGIGLYGIFRVLLSMYGFAVP